MSFLTEDPEPIIVVKDGADWHCYGEPTSLKATYLLGYLHGAGGINETVPDGFLYFNVEQVGDILVTSLEPAPSQS